MSGFFSVFQDENIRRIMPKGKLFTVSCWFVHTKVLFVVIQLYAGAHVLYIVVCATLGFAAVK